MINVKQCKASGGHLFKGKCHKPKFKKGQKVREKTVSWHDKDDKIIVNGTVKKVTFLEKLEGNQPGFHYGIKPTKESVDNLYDTDAQEFQMNFDKPTDSFTPEENITAGWIKEPGYQ